MKFLEDLIRPVEEYLTCWIESGLIWIIILGVILIILYFIFFG